VVVMLVAVSPVVVRGAVTVYADEIPASALVPTAVTNPPATETSAEGAKMPITEHPPVRIDETGVHVGGPNPVDINAPSFVNHHGVREVDLVAIVAIVLGCLVPISIVSIVAYSRHRRFKMQHETMRAMIEKGLPIPPELLTKPNQDNPSQDHPGRVRNDLRGGLILVAVGAGLYMLAGKVGWILVFIGAARLVVWIIDDRKKQ
jgi:hypothetical protein